MITLHIFVEDIHEEGISEEDISEEDISEEDISEENISMDDFLLDHCFFGQWALQALNVQSFCINCLQSSESGPSSWFEYFPKVPTNTICNLESFFSWCLVSY